MTDDLDIILDKERKAVTASSALTLEEKRQIVIGACHPKQRQAVEDRGRRISLLTGRGCGKTTTMRARISLRMLSTPRAKCLFVATTRAQADELFWLPFKDLVDKLGIAARFNETKMRCTFVDNGATVRCVGADDMREIDKLRGQPFHEVDIDEGASYPVVMMEHLLYRIIGPRLGDYNGTIVLGGTPGHVLAGPFYEATRSGSDAHRAYDDRDDPQFADWERWSSHRWTLEDGAPFVPAMARLWDEAQREKRANGWSDDHPIWLREYRGQWAADDTESIYRYRVHGDDGQLWNQWSPERDRNGLAVLPRGFDDWSYVYGMDMGHSDPFALEVFAWSPSDPSKTLYHVYEHEKREMYTRKIAELLLGEGLDANSPGGLIGATGWPDGMVADHAGLGGAILHELRDVYGIRIEPASKKDKHDSVEMFNGDLIDGRIKVMKSSVLEEQLLTLQWSVDDYGRLKEHRGVRNDCADAAIYARRRAHHLLGEADEESVSRAEERRRRGPVDDDIDDAGDGLSDVLGDGGYYESSW